MGHGVRKIEKEGTVLVGLYKGDGFFGVARGDMHDWVFNGFLVAAEHNGAHVVGVKNAEVGVEAMTGGIVFGQMAQMPFPDDLRGVALVSSSASVVSTLIPWCVRRQGRGSGLRCGRGSGQ